MQIKILAGAAAVVAALAFTACSSPAAPSAAPATTPAAAATTAPVTQAAALKGTFAGLNGKNVTGTVEIKDGQIVLSGFKSDEGPDLHIWLTKGTDEAAVKAGKQIAPVAYDKADQTFALSGVDASAYTNVVIHCDKALAVFGAATLA